MFGDDRLIATLKKSKSAAEAVTTVNRKVLEFVSSEPQSDDVTILSFGRE
jgi:serine phosphatase RsbU (regulator of sigma subunit)